MNAEIPDKSSTQVTTLLDTIPRRNLRQSYQTLLAPEIKGRYTVHGLDADVFHFRHIKRKIIVNVLELTQKRLALFVIDKHSGTPLRKVPVYAEIVLNPPSERSIRCSEFKRIQQTWPKLARVVEHVLLEHMDENWLNDDCWLLDLVIDWLERTFGLENRELDEAELALLQQEVDRLISEHDIPAPENRSPDYRIPLGVLGTDHTGYASFDLERLRLDRHLDDARAESEIEIFAYPLLLESNRIPILKQYRVGPDAIVGSIALSHTQNPIHSLALNLPAMQNPGLADWRLSPGSFAAVPQTLIGTDGCESLTPATFAVSTFHLRQVIRLNEKVSDTEHPAALVNEFAISFIPIGHSLGQVQYSLPLAPGESVRLAVIDWRREDSASREESTNVSEALVHSQTHDRMVTETMKAALDEWQRGGSVMGGTAGGAGGAASWGGLASVAGGSMHSIGGGYSTSSGSKDLTSDTQQKVADSVSQATTAVRELHSTVVVKTTQHESEQIETRAFANFNRGHTMTVLYYEVLRHFRLVSAFTKQYRAVLLPRPVWTLTDETLLLDKQYVLEGVLLDRTLVPAFAALSRADKVRAERKRNPPVSVVPPNDAEIVFTSFTMVFKVGGENSSNAFSMSVIKKDGSRTPLLSQSTPNLNKDEAFDNENSEFTIVSDPSAGFRWEDIKEFHFRKDSDAYDDALRVIKIEITGNSAAGPRLLHPHTVGATYYLNNTGDDAHLPVVPPPPPPAPPPIPTLEQAMNGEDYAMIERLKAHLTREKDYYERVLDLTTNPNSFAREFEQVAFSSGMQIDYVSPTPLEIFGTKIAFPLLDQEDFKQPEIEPTERLISLPTRGLFAEAKLGHCNVAEEIDETRFWRWDEHPLPLIASEIAPVVPVQPAPQTPQLAPTALPNPVVTVQTPTSIPDPSGLTAILTAITTPNVFRDMSMKEEISKLLSDLIEGSVSMADAAVQAGAIKKNMDHAETKNDFTKEAIAQAVESHSSAERAQAEQQKIKDQQVSPSEAQHAIKVAENQANKGLISDTEVKEVAKTQVQNIKGSKPVPATKARNITFEVVIRGYGGTNIVGQWAWELWQKGESKGFRPLERHDDGRIVMKTVVTEKDDPRFRLDISGEVLAGYAVNSTFNAKNLDFEIPESVWSKRNYIYVTLNAVIGTYTTTAKNGREAVQKFADSIGGELGFEKAIIVKGSGGLTWEKTDTTSREAAIEVTVDYYKGGLEITKIS